MVNYVSSPGFAASVNGGKLLLKNETNSWVFETPAHIAIARGLAQGSITDDSFRYLVLRYGEEAVQNVWDEFARIGFLRPRPANDNRMSTLAWWEAVGGEPGKRVSVEALEVQGADVLSEALASSGIEIAATAPLKIVLTGDYLRPELDAALAGQTPCLLAKMVGHAIWLGPLFRAGKTVCYCCLTWWLRMHRWEHYAVISGVHGTYPQQASLAHTPATLMTAAGLITGAAAVILTHGVHPELQNQVLTFDTTRGVTASKAVRAGPFCRLCAPMLALGRSQSLRRFYTPMGGMVRNLDVRSDSRLSNQHAAAEFVYPLPKESGKTMLKSAFSFGSGSTRYEAEQNCIAEAIERYSSAWRGDEETISTRPNQIDCIHPERLLLFSPSQYTNRESLNLTGNEFSSVPERLGPEHRIKCVRARSLTGDREVMVPAGIVFFGWPFEGEPVYAIPDSTGCAAGRTNEEAITNALFELIERDAVAIWWYNRASRPAVRLDHFDDPAITSLVSGFRNLGRYPYLIDITTDLAVPAYAALAPRADGSEPIFSAAANTSPMVAAAKAFKELAQIHVWKELASPPRAFRDWLSNTNVNEKANMWLRSSHEVAPLKASALDHREQIRMCRGRLAKAGIESYWIDLTRPEIGLPVVRVVAPGLRHPWARFGTGRLYDVPVLLGWREKPLREADLNPNLCFI